MRYNSVKTNPTKPIAILKIGDEQQNGGKGRKFLLLQLLIITVRYDTKIIKLYLEKLWG